MEKEFTPIELPNTAHEGNSASKTTKAKQSLSRTKAERERSKLRVMLNDEESPLDYFLRVMRDPTVPDARRDEMAKAAAPYMHPRQPPKEAGIPTDLNDLFERLGPEKVRQLRDILR